MSDRYHKIRYSFTPKEEAKEVVKEEKVVKQVVDPLRDIAVLASDPVAPLVVEDTKPE